MLKLIFISHITAIIIMILAITTQKNEDNIYKSDKKTFEIRRINKFNYLNYIIFLSSIIFAITTISMTTIYNKKNVNKQKNFDLTTEKILSQSHPKIKKIKNGGVSEW